MAGLGLNLKLVLYLQSQCLTESLGFLNPPLLQAAKRYGQVAPTFLLLTRKKSQSKIPVCQVSRKWILGSKRCLELKLPVEN